MNSRLLVWSITSALAGFLFGFDTVVISGAEQKIQALWGLSPGMHGVAMGAALYGTVLGSLLGGWPTDRFGRRATLLWIGVLYLVSAIFPNRQRAEGQALGSFTHWIFAALLTTFFPKMVTAFAPGYVFLFFCGMMVLQLLWVRTMVPETKGVPLEQMQRRLGVASEPV
jgi:MFS family permease